MLPTESECEKSDKELVGQICSLYRNSNGILGERRPLRGAIPSKNGAFWQKRSLPEAVRLLTLAAKAMRKGSGDATQSMSRVGRCIGNGSMEAFWGTLKAEMYYLRRFDDYAALEAAIAEY
jgi:hypothetical protein